MMYLFMLCWCLFIAQNRISHFSLKLMDIESEQLGIPDTDYKCIVSLSSEEFQRICRELTIMGDTVKISASKEGVKLSVTGDSGSGSIICRNNHDDEDEKDNVHIKLEQEVEMSFALRYLNFFCKATPLSSNVKLKMSPDVPLVVEYGIGDEAGHIR